MKNKKLRNFIVYFLIMALSVMSFNGCIQDNNDKEIPIITPQIDTTQIAETITQELSNGNSDNAQMHTADDLITTGTEISPSSIEYSENTLSDIDFFVYGLIAEEYEGYYDIFDATLKCEDHSEIYGIGYTDYETYFEAASGNKGYFTAGFIFFPGDINPAYDLKETGYEIMNLDYEDDNTGFIYSYVPDMYKKHCIYQNKYIVYGLDENGVITYTSKEYTGNYDKSLGLLYSYDENRAIYCPDLPSYKGITGISTVEEIDYAAVKAEMDRILEEQDKNFMTIQKEIFNYYDPEIIKAHLLETHKSTFLGYDVNYIARLIDSLDPKECVRFTPDGYIVLNVNPPDLTTGEEVARWVVGVSAGLVGLACIVLEFFPTPVKPFLGIVSGATIDVFFQVIAGHNRVTDINWAKVAVSAAAGAVSSLVCPMALGKVKTALEAANAGKVLLKLGTYGVSALSGALVGGITSVANTAIDGNDNYIQAFLAGAAIAAAITVGAMAIGDIITVTVKAVKNSRPVKWIKELIDKRKGTLVNGEEVELVDDVDELLKNKVKYTGKKNAEAEISSQSSKKAQNRSGGGYNDVCDNISTKKYKTPHETHEIPSHSAYDTGLNATTTRKQADLPSVKMTKKDHMKTASWGSTKEAKLYRAKQAELISQGKMEEAFMMDVNDLRSKFGDKYEKGIEEALEYAKTRYFW